MLNKKQKIELQELELMFKESVLEDSEEEQIYAAS